MPDLILKIFKCLNICLCPHTNPHPNEIFIVHTPEGLLTISEPYDMSNKTTQGMVGILRVNFEQEVLFRGSKVLGNQFFIEGGILNQGGDFSALEVEGTISFNSLDCKKNMDLSSVKVKENLELNHLKIQGALDLSNCIVEGNAEFNCVEFDSINLSNARLTRLRVDDEMEEVFAKKISDAVLGREEHLKATFGIVEFNTEDLATFENIYNGGRNNTNLREKIYDNLAEEIALLVLNGDAFNLKNADREINTQNIESLKNLHDSLREKTFEAIEVEQLSRKNENIESYYKEKVNDRILPLSLASIKFQRGDNDDGIVGKSTDFIEQAVAQFDPLIYAVSNNLYKSMKPQERVLLSWTQRLTSQHTSPERLKPHQH